MNAKFPRPMIVALAVMMVAGLCSQLAFGQESIQQRFEKSLQSEISNLKAQTETPEPISDEIVQDEPQELEPLAPAPDPAFLQAAPEPTIEYLASAPQASAERLPRGLLLTAPYCGPCERIKTENPDLIGGPDAALEVIDTTRANQLDELGVSPGMLQGNPTILILDENGKIHGLSANGFGCKLYGYQSPQKIRDYLTSNDHRVKLGPLEASETPAAAVLENAPKSIDTLAAAVAWHVLQSESEISNLKSQMPEAGTFGSLLEVNVDAPDAALEIGRKILTVQRWSFPAAGVTLDWTGPARTISLERGRITVKPGVAMTVSKWRITKSCRLDAITYTDDLSSVTFELSGMLDLTVNLR
jgi:hypothetical protein